MSMAASEYLSTKSEEISEIFPVVGQPFTREAYIFTVTALVLPLSPSQQLLRLLAVSWAGHKVDYRCFQLLRGCGKSEEPFSGVGRDEALINTCSVSAWDTLRVLFGIEVWIRLDRWPQEVHIPP